MKLFLDNKMNIEKIRRDNLVKYIALNYKNKRQFSLIHNINYGNLYTILKAERPFGERFARDLEANLGVTPGFFDQFEDNLSNHEQIKIPIYGNKLSAGNGNNVFDEEIIGFHLLNTADLRNEGLDEKNLCAFYVSGDSMLPEIPDGAKILVDVAQKNLIDNKIYAISIESEIFIKKLFKELGTRNLILRSENKNYPDKIYNNTTDLKIIGRVVYLLGKRL